MTFTSLMEIVGMALAAGGGAVLIFEILHRIEKIHIGKGEIRIQMKMQADANSSDSPAAQERPHAMPSLR
jgi:hypothetical protein